MLRYVFLAIGAISLIVGLIGILVPLLPTTPFVLLAAWLFAKSSKRCHNWLLCHNLTGPIISAWETNRSMPRKAKIYAIIMLSVSIGFSALFVLNSIPLKAALILLGLAAVSVILMVPTTESLSTGQEN